MDFRSQTKVHENKIVFVNKQYKPRIEKFEHLITLGLKNINFTILTNSLQSTSAM